eukprot:SAG11_NODE_969_length_6347_cov_13.010871_1_plen_39_part_00
MTVLRFIVYAFGSTFLKVPVVPGTFKKVSHATFKVFKY